MTTGKLDHQLELMNLGCPGSHRVERSYQPRLIALWIVPNYVKDLSRRSREAAKADN